MAFAAKIIADSINEFDQRLTTVELSYPRFIHAEILTHRDRARNSASSRAIPWPKMMERIVSDPVIPIRWGSEQKGMQAGAEIPEEDRGKAQAIWLRARDSAVKAARELAELGVHKSLVNRITEPWMWITVVMTATEWKNLFRLRLHGDAEVHFQKIAEMLHHEMTMSVPWRLEFGRWHMPYMDADDLADCRAVGADPRKVSVARCARVSYLTHDGKRSPSKDLELFDKLCEGSGFGHWSPHEHVAMSATRDTRSGPFRGWIQYRKLFANECTGG